MRITDFCSIVAFRNLLVHAYAQIDDRIVWGIVESKLPLRHEVAELMKDEPEV
ncbi:MAG: HepT-like ribonuclease domain-containing protein [Acidobacteriaceae bacterium]